MNKKNTANKSKRNIRAVLEGVSFVTTVYNEEDSMLAFLESLIVQEFLPGEIVIVDGGSNDNTLNITLDFFRNKVMNIKKISCSIKEIREDKTVMIGDKKDGNLVFSSKIFFNVNKKSVNCNDGNKKGDETSKIHIKVIVKKGANISQGRNIAIRNTKNEIICVSDAGCILDKNWVEEITKFYNSRSCNIIGGFSCPICDSFLQRCLAMCIMPKREEVNGSKFMPSSRNISFKKSIWENVGGYPENMDYGEDMKFNFNIKDRGFSVKFNPDAVVYWKMRKDMIQIFKQFFRYAKGDAAGKMYMYRHMIRFISFIFLVAALTAAFSLNLWILIIFIPLFAGYVFKPYSRLSYIWGEADDIQVRKTNKFLSVLFIPFLLFYIDIAKFLGYIYGMAKIKRA